MTGVGAVAVTSAALLASATAASASTHPEFWVATTGAATGANTSCATARYSTVQSAVNAAESLETAQPSPRPTVELCPGTYQEQVTITKSLTVTHAPAPRGQVVIELPATPAGSTTNCQATDTSAQVPQSVLEICAAAAGGANTEGVSVSIRRVTVEGDWPADVCNDNLYGILVEGGATLFLDQSTVENVGADPLTAAGGCQGGVGVDAGNSYTGQVGHADLGGDTIDTYQKNGVVIDGSGSTGNIIGTTVTGAGATPYIAQNGIQISTGATGSVAESVVSGNNYTGKGEASSSGILVYGGGASCGGGDPESGLVARGQPGRQPPGQQRHWHRTVQPEPPVRRVRRHAHARPGLLQHHQQQPRLPRWCPVSRCQHQRADHDDRLRRGSGRCQRHRQPRHHLRQQDQRSGLRPAGQGSSLPNPPAPAWVRPIDVFSYAAAIHPRVSGNRYDGKPYNP